MLPFGGGSPPGPMMLGQVVVGVRRHWQNSMAFVTFISEEHSRVVIAYPPAVIGGVAVMPAQHHKSDCRAIVLRWTGPPEAIPDEVIVAHFENAFRELLQTAASGDVSASLAALGADPGGASQVTAVKKHRVQPMAFVSFQSPEAAAIVVKAPPTSIAGVGVLPVQKHQSEPYSVVLRWMGEQSVLSEEQIAHEFNSLFGQAVPASSPAMDLTAAVPGGPSRLVASVKKHTKQLMCFVNFVSEDAALAFCAMPMTAIGEVGVNEIKRHWTQPFCSVVEFSMSAAGLTEEVIAAEIETHFSTTLQGQSISEVSRVLAAAGFGAMPAQHGQAEQVAQGSLCVSQVQKHQHLPMAYVTFRSPQMVQYVLGMPIETLCGVKVLPPSQHQNNPHVIILRWTGNMGDLTEEGIATGFDSLMPAVVSAPSGSSASFEALIANQFSMSSALAPVVSAAAGSSASFEALALQLMQEPMQQQISHPPIQSVQPQMPQFKSQHSLQLPKPMIPGLLGVGAHASPGEEVSSLSTFGPQGGWVGSGAVTLVRKHWQQPMAYVTFDSAEAAQSAVATPPTRIGKLSVMPAMAHKSDPSSVVIRWQGLVTELTEEAIAAVFEGIATKAAAPPKGAPLPDFSASLGRAPVKHLVTCTPPGHGIQHCAAIHHVVKRIMKHQSKPVAFAEFHVAESARMFISTAPSELGSAPVEKIQAHWNQKTTVVVHFKCPIESVREAEVAHDIENLLANKGAAKPEASLKRPAEDSPHQLPLKAAKGAVDGPLGVPSSNLSSASEIVQSLLSTRADPAIVQLLGICGIQQS